jgi:hypothetical protein
MLKLEPYRQNKIKEYLKFLKYRYLPLSVSEIKHVSLARKCTGEVITFSNTGPHRVSYVLSRS